jgi:hypothetical protein
MEITIGKKFVRSGWFSGAIVSFDDVSKTFTTAYEDDDDDQMGFAAIARWLPAKHACLLKSWLSDSSRQEANRGNKRAENKEEDEKEETEKAARAPLTSIKIKEEAYDCDGA